MPYVNTPDSPPVTSNLFKQPRDLFGYMDEKTPIGTSSLGTPLSEKYAEQADNMLDGDMYLGPVLINIPPQAIAVSDSYQVQNIGGAIRQRSSMKWSKGRYQRQIQMNLYFSDSLDAGSNPAGISNLIEVVNLFRISPFVPVYNKYLNETWGIDALALVNLSITSDRSTPGGYYVNIIAEQFNYKSYVPYATSYSSIINAEKYTQFIKRGLDRLEQEMTTGQIVNAAGKLPKLEDIDFFIHDIIPQAVGGNYYSWDRLFKEAEYPQFALDALEAKFGKPLIEGLTWGIPTTTIENTSSHWDGTQVSAVLDGLEQILGENDFRKIRLQLGINMGLLTSTGGSISTAKDESLNSITARYILQMINVKLGRIGKGPEDEPFDLDDLAHQTPNATWIEEWKVPMIPMNLTDNVTLHSISVSVTNHFSRLPILSQSQPTHQYLGGGGIDLAINMEVMGEEDVANLRKMMERSQEVARLTRAIGTLGFLGIRSDITRTIGCKYFMPVNLTVQTNEEVPHLYSVSMTLTDFDIFQQEKEVWTKNKISQLMKGNPFLRLKEFGKYYQLYPDFPLLFSEESGWEPPDFYFITTPISEISNNIQSNNPDTYTTQYIAAIGAPGVAMKYAMKIDQNTGCSIVDPEGASSEEIKLSETNDITATAEDKTKNAADIDSTMAGAFPCYVLFLVDEPRNLLVFKTFGDFYGRRSIVDIKLHTNQNPMFDTCQVTMSDMYKKSSTPEDEYVRKDLGSIVATVEKYWDRYLNIVGAGSENISHIALEPGMRLQLRLGYGSDIGKLDTVFNGTISDVMPANGVLTVIAQGDGRELLGFPNPGNKQSDTVDISGLMFSEPRDLIIKLLTQKTSSLKNALALAMQGNIAPDPKGGIRHFGMLLFNKLSDEQKSTGDDIAAGVIDNIVDAILPTLSGGTSAGEVAGGIAGWVGNPAGAITGQILADKIRVQPAGTLSEIAAQTMFPENQAWTVTQEGNATELFKKVLKQALKNIWMGWDSEIFKRNIYAGNGIGIPEKGSVTEGGLKYEITKMLVDGTITKIPWLGQSQIGQTLNNLTNPFAQAAGLVELFDYKSALDEPSFKLRTYQRSTWDIMQSATDICPNYVLAVRPFENRSTLFFGKPFWAYTSGVMSTADVGAADWSDLEDVIDRINKQILSLEENPEIYVDSIVSPDATAQEVAAKAYTTTTPGDQTGAGRPVRVDWLEDYISMSPYLKGMGADIVKWSSRFGVPWEWVLAVMWLESTWATKGASQYYNNPGNMKWAWNAKWSEFPGKVVPSPVWPSDTGDPYYFCVYPTEKDGVYAMFNKFANDTENGYKAFIAANAYLDFANKYYGVGDNPDVQGDAANYAKDLQFTVEKYIADANAASAYLDLNTIPDGWRNGVAPTPPSTAVEPLDPNRIPPSKPGLTPGAQLPPTRDVKFDVVSLEKDVREFIDDQAFFDEYIVTKNLHERSDSAFCKIFEQWDSLPHRGQGDLRDTVFAKVGVPGKVVKASIGDDSWNKGTNAIHWLNEKVTDPFIEQERAWMGVMFKGPFKTWLFANFESFYTFCTNNSLNDDQIRGQVGAAFVLFVVISGTQSTEKLKVIWRGTEPTSPPAQKEGAWDTAVYYDYPGGITFEAFKYDDPVFYEGLYPQYNSIISQFNLQWTNALWDDGALTPIKAIGQFLSGASKVISSLISLAFNTLPYGFKLLSIAKQMNSMAKVMDPALLDSRYYQAGPTDNAFTREFGEPVVEIRETFSRIHYCTSFTDMIDWAVGISDSDVYPVITSVSDGKNPQTVYADKSISAEFQREKIVETFLCWELFNFNEAVHAKRIGLAGCARSLKTMYQGNVSMLGNGKIRPWDYIYMADAYDDYWGMCEVQSVTHLMSTMGGWTTSVEINPVVIVDDPAEWAWTTSLHNLMAGGVVQTAVVASMVGTAGDTAIADSLKSMGSIKAGTGYSAAIGAGAVTANIIMGGTPAPSGTDVEINDPLSPEYTVTMKKYDGMKQAFDVANVAYTLTKFAFLGDVVEGVTGLMGIPHAPTPSEVMGWVDGREDVYIGLLTHNGKPYQAGLKGANGIVIGEQKSTGFDIIDLFMKDRPTMTWNDFWKEGMGGNSAGYAAFVVKQRQELAKIFATLLQDSGKGGWATPLNGWVNRDVEVVGVQDGDTIYVRSSRVGGANDVEVIRFQGVDAYELSDVPRGGMAKKIVEDLVHAGEIVTLKLWPGPEYLYDKYGRTLAWVYNKDGVNVNLAVYSAGLGTIRNTEKLDNEGTGLATN
jgi:endonuclease YncB( thermonuclease family)